MSHYETADAWPAQAYATPVRGKENPWNFEDASPNHLEAPTNPAEFDVNQLRHESHTDENATTMYDQYGRGDSAVGMNKLLDPTYQPDVQHQPGIGPGSQGLDGSQQVEPSADAARDGMDNWPHLLEMLGKQSNALEVRIAPNRQLVLNTIYIPANTIVPVLAPDPRRQKVTLYTATAQLVYLGVNAGDLSNLNATTGPYFVLDGSSVSTGLILPLAYDGELWATATVATSVSIAIERDR